MKALYAVFCLVITLNFAVAQEVNAPTREKDMSAYFNSYLDQCVKVARNTEDPSPFFGLYGWEANMKYSVPWFNDEYFSYLGEEMRYTGGVSSTWTAKCGTIERSTGRKLTIDDIASTPRQKKILLQVLARQRLTGESPYKTVKELEDNNLMPQLTDNFYFHDEGLTFVYSKYEIDSGSAGVVKILLPGVTIKMMIDTPK